MTGGLRGRLLVALVATSLATLAAAGLTILPPLEHRLEADRLADLRGLARTARVSLQALPPGALRPHDPRLAALADRLQRRTGGRIAVYDNTDRVLSDTARSRARIPLGQLGAERTQALRHRDHVASGTVGGRAYGVAVVEVDEDFITLVIGKRLDDTRAAASVVRGALPGALAAGLAVALALAVLLSRSLLTRLRRLQSDARALGEEGLTATVTVTGGDEVAEVAGAVERMRRRLVDEETSRRAFVATASHELRTPLASLQATLELLQEELRDGRVAPVDASARADTALRQTHRLIALATDLLDLSRVDGHAPLHPEPLELGEICRMVTHEFAPRLAAAGRPLLVAGGPVLTLADPGAVTRIVRILLDNACGYGAGAVTVTLGDDADGVAVTVADEGPGLADDEHDTVFLRFARGRAARLAPAATGIGLGLPIARGLARAMGGDVTAVTGVRGGVFRLTLPAWHGEP